MLLFLQENFPKKINRNDLSSKFANCFKSKVDNLKNSTSSTDCGLLTDSPDLDYPERLIMFILLNSDEL